MAELRTMLRRYERAQERANRTGLDLAQAIQERIRDGGYGEAAACARELGWDRRRLRHWLRSRTGPADLISAKEVGGARPVRDDASTDGIDSVMAEMHTRMLEDAGLCTNCGHTWACHAPGADDSFKGVCPDPLDLMTHTCPQDGATEPNRTEAP